MADHLIKKGDTLSGIAKKYGTTVDKLAALNNIPKEKVGTIYAGDTLKISEDAPAAEPTNTPTPMPDYSAAINNAYAQAQAQQAAALEAAYQAAKTQYQNQQNKVGDQYDAIRNQAYVNSRLNAVGNNEALAALGLAGNLYADPISGTSETSRVTQNVGLRNNINAATRAEQSMIDELTQAIIQAGYTKNINTANAAAQLAVQQANALMQAQQLEMQQAQLAQQTRANDLEYQMNLWQFEQAKAAAERAGTPTPGGPPIDGSTVAGVANAILSLAETSLGGKQSGLTPAQYALSEAERLKNSYDKYYGKGYGNAIYNLLVEYLKG